MWELHSKTWGTLTAESFGLRNGVAELKKVRRHGEPFRNACMIPLHDLTLITPPSDDTE